LGAALAPAVAATGGSTAPVALQDRAFGQPACVRLRGYRGDAMEPFITRDGRYLLFNSSNAPGAQTDLQVARLQGDLVAQYLGPLRGANSPQLDGVATTTLDGTLYFISTRSYSADGITTYQARFDNGVASAVRPVPGLPREPGWLVFDVAVTARGNALIYSRGAFRGGSESVAADLRVAAFAGDRLVPDPSATALLDSVNTPSALEYAAAISLDDRELFLTRLQGKTASIYRATRASVTAPFGRARRVAAIDGFVEGPALSPDGQLLYYHQRVGKQFRICHVRRLH
jgi:hypothetical protein